MNGCGFFNHFGLIKELTDLTIDEIVKSSYFTEFGIIENRYNGHTKELQDLNRLWQNTTGFRTYITSTDLDLKLPKRYDFSYGMVLLHIVAFELERVLDKDKVAKRVRSKIEEYKNYGDISKDLTRFVEIASNERGKIVPSIIFSIDIEDFLYFFYDLTSEYLHSSENLINYIGNRLRKVRNLGPKIKKANLIGVEDINKITSIRMVLLEIIGEELEELADSTIYNMSDISDELKGRLREYDELVQDIFCVGGEGLYRIIAGLCLGYNKYIPYTYNRFHSNIRLESQLLKVYNEFKFNGLEKFVAQVWDVYNSYEIKSAFSSDITIAKVRALKFINEVDYKILSRLEANYGNISHLQCVSYKDIYEAFSLLAGELLYNVICKVDTPVSFLPELCEAINKRGYFEPVRIEAIRELKNIQIKQNLYADKTICFTLKSLGNYNKFTEEIVNAAKNHKRLEGDRSLDVIAGLAELYLSLDFSKIRYVNILSNPTIQTDEFVIRFLQGDLLGILDNIVYKL